MAHLIINEIPCINQTVLSTMIGNYVEELLFNSYFIDDKFLDEIYEELQMFNAIVNDGRSV